MLLVWSTFTFSKGKMYLHFSTLVVLFVVTDMVDMDPDLAWERQMELLQELGYSCEEALEALIGKYGEVPIFSLPFSFLRNCMS